MARSNVEWDPLSSALNDEEERFNPFAKSAGAGGAGGASSTTTTTTTTNGNVGKDGNSPPKAPSNQTPASPSLNGFHRFEPGKNGNQTSKEKTAARKSITTSSNAEKKVGHKSSINSNGAKQSSIVGMNDKKTSITKNIQRQKKSSSSSSSSSSSTSSNGKNEHELEIAEQNLVNIGYVTYISPNQDTLVGTLRVTNFRLHFEPNGKLRDENRQWFFQNRSLFDVHLGSIEKLSRVSSNQIVGGRGKDSLMLHIVCKDFRKLQFKFANVADACKVYDLVKISAFPISEGQGLKWMFAMEHGKLAPKGKGWSIFNPIEEWIRQGIFQSKEDLESSRYWRVSRINANYTFCPSYPHLMVMPSTVSDGDLHIVGGFSEQSQNPRVSMVQQKK